MSKVVRIGGAGGFLGDSSMAAPQLLKGGKLDYMILDYLAEATMSALGQLKAARPDQGFARDFTEWVWKDNLQDLKAQGVKIVTNAGGLNPHACRARMEELAAAAGLSFKIAVVEGDDLMDRLGDLQGRGLTEMFTDAAFPDPARVFTANAYFGGYTRSYYSTESATGNNRYVTPIASFNANGDGTYHLTTYGSESGLAYFDAPHFHMSAATGLSFTDAQGSTGSYTSTPLP